MQFVVQTKFSGTIWLVENSCNLDECGSQKRLVSNGPSKKRKNKKKYIYRASKLNDL